ncbi:MAG TPA: hypothetical protein VGN95_14575 [Pyrinomonadaceae bacterium]|jgi:hypothetical protein|nr:hypothetical protein [Pyrinomonadaceae bacterium]
MFEYGNHPYGLGASESYGGFMETLYQWPDGIARPTPPPISMQVTTTPASTAALTTTSVQTPQP